MPANGSERIWRAVLLAAGCFFLWTALLYPVLASREIPRDTHGHTYYSDSGEALIHGVTSPEGGISRRMPLCNLLAAVIFEHGGAVWRRGWESLPELLLTLLLFAFGALNGSLLSGLSAALLYHAAVAGHPEVHWGYRQPYYAVLVMLVAVIAAWRPAAQGRAAAASPGFVRSALLGLAIGVSLLYRSPLAPFPLILAVYVFVSEHRCSFKSSWRPVLALLALSYGALLPVGLMRQAVFGEFSFFEGAVIYNNVVTGVLGGVTTVVQDWEVSAHGIDPNSPGEVFSWAVHAVARDPGGYARAFLHRLAFTVAQQPLLAALAAAALWLRRRDPALRPPALLAGIFVVEHCALSIRSDYLVPLWPVLAGLAAYGLGPPEGVPGAGRARWTQLARYASLGGFLAGGIFAEPRLAWLLVFTVPWAEARPQGEPARRSAGAVALSVLLPAAALAAYALVLVGRYGALARSGALRSAAALDAAVAAAPEDAWLRARRGRWRLEAGDFSGAAEDYGRSLALRPGREDRRLTLAWTRMLAGSYGPILRFRPSWGAMDFESDEGRTLGIRLHLARAAAQRRLRRAEEARRELETALEAWEANLVTDHLSAVHGGSAARHILSRGFLLSVFARDYLWTWCGHLLSPQDKAALVALLRGSAPGDRELALLQAEAAAQAGDRRTAAAALRGVEPASIQGRETGRILRLWRSVGRDPGLSALVRGLLRRDPDGVGLRMEVAWIAHSNGDRALVREALVGAESATSASAAQRLELVKMRSLMGENGGALAAIDRLLAAGAGGLPCAAWLQVSGLAQEASGRGEAARALALAESARPTPEESRRIAVRYQELGEFAGALRVLDALVHAQPRQARFWCDRGVLKSLMGRNAEAIEDLSRARRLDAGDLATALSLGRVLAAAGRDAELPELYERALRERSPESPAELVAMIRSEKDRIAVGR